jgi:excisionase family DNA binding protein
MASSPETNKSTQFAFDFEAEEGPPPSRRSEPLLTILEVCALYNAEPHVVRKSIRNGSIPSYRLGNGRIRLRASDIEATIAASKQGGAK